MASSVTKDDWAFQTVVAVLGFAAIVGSLTMLLALIIRRETAVNQPEYAVNGIPMQNAPMNAAP